MMKSQKFAIKKLIGIFCVLTLIIGAIYTPLALAVKAANEITVTFVDTLNSTENKITGNKGESFVYPEDPIDQSNKKWFMGWFTDETYKTEHTDGLFGEDDITLYAKWLGEYPSYTQDFENYTMDQYKVTVNSSTGAKEKDNRLYFFEGAEKQSAVTYDNSGNAIKIPWDSTMVKDPEVAGTYDAAGRWNSIDRKINLNIKALDNVLYKLTFKYYVEKADTSFNFTVSSAATQNIWTGAKHYTGKIECKNEAKWNEAVFEFTTQFKDGYDYIYLVMNLTENKDVTVYIDDVKLEPVSQPYESNLVIKTGYGSDEIITGNRGAAINLPTLVHPDGAEFLGYFADETFTTEFDKTKFERKPITVYAKWGAAPLTFKNHPYTITLRAFYALSLKNEKGIGYNDDYALNFLFDGDASYQRPNDTEPQIFYKRYATQDYCIRLCEVNNGSVYRITYYRKASDECQSDYSIGFMTSNTSNIYNSGVVLYPNTKVTAKADEKDWVKETVFLFPNFEIASSNVLYMYFNSLDGTADSYVDVYVDNVLIEEITDDTLYFDGNADGVGAEIVTGKAGDAFTAPTFKNGKCEFLGWFLDADCTKPFTATTIPAGFTIVYAKWSAAPEAFEKLPYPLTNADRAYYTISAKNGKNLGNGDDYALQFLFDGDASYQRPKDSEPTILYKRAGSIDNSVKVGNITSGIPYKVSFYTKAASDSNTDATINLSTAADNIWSAGYVSYTDTKITVKTTETDWVYREIYFIPNVTVANATALYLQILPSAFNEKTYSHVYIDDLSIEALSGDVIYFNANASGVLPAVVVGTAGDSFTAPTLKNGKSELLGWYLDADCTVPFTATTIPSGVTVVYAKWSAAPIVFEKLPYELKVNERAYYSLSVKEGKGVGYGDDYALNFLHDGDKTYKRPSDAAPTTMYERATAIDNSIKMCEVIDGVVYKVSFYVKSGKNSKSDYTVQLVTANSSNIWAPGYKNYPSTLTTVEAKDKEWKYVEYYISPVIEVSGANSLMLRFNCCDITATGYVDGYVDDFMIEKIDAPYVFFDFTAGEKTVLVKGEAGEKITLPAKPTAFVKSFKGWFTDYECTTKFELTEFAKDTALTVYAGWKDSTEVTFTFEKFNVPHRGEDTSVNIRRDAHAKTNSKALSGSKVIEVDRTPNQTYASYFPLANTNSTYSINNKNVYVVTVNYYISKKPSNPTSIAICTAQPHNYWGTYIKGSRITVSTDTEVGKWHQAYLLVDGSKLAEGTTGLFMEITGGGDGIILFDNIVVKQIPLGNGIVVVDSGGCKGLPTVLNGKPGQSYSSKFPEAPTFGDKYFKGYFYMDENGSYVELKREDMKFDAKKPLMVYARFLNRQVSEGFESDFYTNTLKTFHVYGAFDFDYEIYDSQANGNSKDNVTGGRYSLRRKGNTNFNENALILSRHNMIAEGERYTVNFKVKMGAHKHTDGAIKIVSCRTYNYAWDTMGDYYPVVAIAELADGQWHEVSYTFNSVEDFVSLQTPGQVELFFDDFTFTIANETPLSTPVEFTEHLIGAKTMSDGVDISTIIDTSLIGGSSPVLWIIIAGAAVLVIAAAAVVFIIIKKKKV